VGCNVDDQATAVPLTAAVSRFPFSTVETSQKSTLHPVSSILVVATVAWCWTYISSLCSV